MITYYISPTGNDNHNGTTLENAFATLNCLQETTRQQAGKSPITVNFTAGTYALNETWTFTEQDSGTESAPIIYCAHNQETVTLTSSQANTLIKLTNTQHITFQNITFEHTPHNAIEIQDGSHIHLKNCTLTNIGQTAITVNDGTNHTIQNCTIHHTGQSAITLNGGNRQTLTPANHQIDNCQIHYTSQSPEPPSPAIQISGVGNHVSHNHIHHTPHSAITIAGNEHLITHNHIHHTHLTTHQTGAIDMGGDWTERGTRIQYNHIHDLGNHNTIAIHLNNCASSVTILGNLFVRCPLAILIGGGLNNRIDNNIFAHCNPAIQIDGRGLSKDAQWHTHLHTHMKNNFEKMNPLEPPFSQYYPELREVAMYYQTEDGIPPEGNLILRNITHQSPFLNIHNHATPKLIATQNNLTYEDPLFTDAPNDNYTLQETSPAHEIGIKPLPLDRMGPLPPT